MPRAWNTMCRKSHWKRSPGSWWIRHLPDRTEQSGGNPYAVPTVRDYRRTGASSHRRRRVGSRDGRHIRDAPIGPYRPSVCSHLSRPASVQRLIGRSSRRILPWSSPGDRSCASDPVIRPGSSSRCSTALSNERPRRVESGHPTAPLVLAAEFPAQGTRCGDDGDTQSRIYSRNYETIASPAIHRCSISVTN